MQKSLMFLLDDAVKEAAFWEVENKSREEWLFGYPAELALLAGQVKSIPPQRKRAGVRGKYPPLTIEPKKCSTVLISPYKLSFLYYILKNENVKSSKKTPLCTLKNRFLLNIALIPCNYDVLMISLAVEAIVLWTRIRHKAAPSIQYVCCEQVNHNPRK